MKRFMSVLAILAVTGLAVTAFAAPPIQHPQVLVGKIVSVDASTGDVVVAVEGQHGKAGQQVTVATHANTKVSIDGKAASMDKLKADMLVRVKPATGTAAAIDTKSPPPPPPLRGTVVSVDTSTGDVVVQPEQGQQVTVTTDARTQVALDRKAVRVDDLKTDMLVKITFSTSTGPATQIDAKSPPPPPPLVGKIASVDTGNGDVAVQPEHGQQVTVVTDASTQVSIDGKAVTVDDLKADMLVKVTLSTSTGPATDIDAKSPPPLVGTVVSVDASGNVTVATEGQHGKAGQQLVVPTDADTQVTIDGKAATVGDLKVGMFVKAQPSTGTAISIAAKSPPPPPPLVGTVVSVDTTTGNVVVAVKGLHMQPDRLVTVPTDSNTQVSIDGKTATVADLKAGMLVEVQPPTGTATDIKARSVPIPPPPPVLVGLVVSVDLATGNVVVTTISRTPAMTTIGGRSVTVPTDANTKITIDGHPATLADLKAGMFVEVKPGTGTATDIEARAAPPPPPPPVLVGLVVSVDITTGNVVVATAGPRRPGIPQQVTVATDSNTTVTLDGNPATLADLKAGMFVEVKPSTGTATDIEARSAPTPIPLLRKPEPSNSF